MTEPKLEEVEQVATTLDPARGFWVDIRSGNGMIGRIHAGRSPV